MFRFASPEYLYLLFLVLAFVIIFIFNQYRKKKILRSIGDPGLIDQLMPEVSHSRPVLKFIISMIAFMLIVLALARPQFGSKLQEVKRKGVEIMIALDVSNSMNAQDIQPSRLERSKQSIAQLVDKLRDDKIGLVVFAGESFVQIPITTDYVSAKMFLNYVNTEIVSVQGTAIGKAINKCTQAFQAESPLQKAIIVITDGENHEDDAITAAQTAKENGITVHTLGMGLQQGAPIPISPDNPTNFKKNNEGSVIISKLNENLLQEIALAGGGIYIRANNSQAGLGKLFEKIDQMNRQEYESVTYTDYDDQFQYFLFAAILLLLIEISIDSKKNRYLSQIKLFSNSN